jgi:hypothetical protein
MIFKSFSDWHPLAKIAYWICMISFIACVLAFFSSPNGALGVLSEKLFVVLTPKYLTLIVNTFALLGAYVVVRLLLVFPIPWRNRDREILGVFGVLWVALTSMALLGARCDVYVFCADDVASNIDCEVDWDRQAPHCR